MKERPILFSTEMVKAILEDHKTMTRRVIKPQPSDDARLIYASNTYSWEIDGGFKELPECPYGQVGDRLWCKEALVKKPDYSWGKEGYVVYVADGEQVLIGGAGINEGVPWEWKRDILTSMFMPRWASRITLEIINIRVERVQDITEADAIKEGIRPFSPNGIAVSSTIPRQRFYTLWNSINAKRGYSWEVNPWVWIIEFKWEISK